MRTDVAQGWSARFAGLTAILLTGSVPEVVVDHYGTLDEARADGLFERGWLPDLLPASTTAIRTSNDLDLNRSTGRFCVAPRDVAAFTARLRAGAPAAAPIAALPAVVARYAQDGFAAHTHEGEAATWVFFCKAATGECQYLSW